MSFRTPDQSLKDILHSILMIEEFVAGVSFEAFHHHPMRIAAVERHRACNKFMFRCLDPDFQAHSFAIPSLVN